MRLLPDRAIPSPVSEAKTDSVSDEKCYKDQIYLQTERGDYKCKT